MTQDRAAEPVSERRWLDLQWEPGLVIVRLSGEIDDRKSAEWRRRLTEQIQLRGSPRFVAFDMHAANPKNSMSTRFEVAAYCRALMKKVDWALILLPAAVGSLVVVRIVMKIVATSRLSVTSSRAEYEAALEAMRKGERPSL